MKEFCGMSLHNHSFSVLLELQDMNIHHPFPFLFKMCHEFFENVLSCIIENIKKDDTCGSDVANKSSS